MCEANTNIPADENTKPFLEWTEEEVDAAYPYFCDCGEQAHTLIVSRDCRKCRRYLESEDHAARKVHHRTILDGKPTFTEVWAAED